MVLGCHGAAEPPDDDPDTDPTADSDLADDTDVGPDTDTSPPAVMRVQQDGVASPCAGEPPTHFATSWTRTPSAPGPASPLIGMGFSVDDLDGDGWLDLLLPSHAGVDLFWGTSTGFSESPTWLGTGLEDASVVAVLDVDDDGDLDLVVLRVLRNAVVLTQDSARAFVHTPNPLLERDAVHTLGASVGDFDHDGRLDLFLANWGKQPIVHPVLAKDAYPNALFRHTPTGWKDSSYQLPSEAWRAWSMLGAWQDFNGDGLDDLFLVNDFGQDANPSRLLLSAPGGFALADDALGLSPVVCGMGLGIADLNDDLVPDVVVSSWGSMSVRESRQGQWFETAASRGVVPDVSRGQVVAWGVAVGDVDNDEDEDVFVAYGRFPGEAGGVDDQLNPLLQPDALYLRDGEAFTDVGAAWGVDHDTSDRGAGWVDLNQDGWLDLLVREADGTLYGHTAACGSAHGLTVRLSQPGPNPRAIGAQVTLHVGDRTLTRWIRSGGTGHGTFTPAEAHFGVGDATTVDRVEVRWPDGTEAAVDGVSVTPSWTIERLVGP